MYFEAFGLKSLTPSDFHIPPSVTEAGLTPAPAEDEPATLIFSTLRMRLDLCPTPKECPPTEAMLKTRGAT